MSTPTGTPEDIKQKTAATYNSAADGYDHPANTFWDRFGRRTVERLNLPLGGRVLDVCCGSGASAIPAARVVGHDGSVLGIDLAEKLLELARAKGQRSGLTNVEFRKGDLLALGLPSQSFDVVICVFGIFFIPDMQAAANELWRLVKPGGKLAVTTWGPRFFEPASTAFWNSVRTVRADLYKSFNPWDRISEPESLRLLLKGTGATKVEVSAEAGTQPVNSAEDWWSMILGSGYRGTVDQLDSDEYEKVRRENLDFISSANVRSIEANVVYGVATRTI
jgi:ubiquinone/menaquinone biosynthesis C-methylase UbiE